ncbi:ER lumen protein-retaining receptor-like [Abrus precatorius]|uniref:ER lumen protein-retaining receptor-like n=1 Tax=Abrus precatorius TaxID=3816 RepID=A0A8B8JX61_ABRPR|nr:ER lumen protein-retaining receptor-like [Abrus precatorius]
MGTKRGNSPMNVLFERLRKQSIKVKILLGALLAVCVLVALNFIIKDHYYFFIASAATHAAGIIALIYKLFAQKTCSGLSLKTQELTALFIAARFSCSTFMVANIHTVLDLISLLSTLLVIWMIRFKLKSSYIKELDNLRLSFVVVPSAILAILIHPFTTHWRFIRVIWAFSLYLEAVSVLPQLRFMRNAKMIETFTGYYVFALGISRFLALAHWVIQIYETKGSFLFLAGSGYFWFLAAFLAEMVQSLILADFCYYYMKSFMKGQLMRKMPV